MPPRNAPEHAEVVALAAEVGIREASRRTGVARSTLHDWCDAAGVEVYAAKDVVAQTANARAVAAEVNAAKRDRLREELRLKLLEKAHDLLERMDRPHVEFKGNNANQVEYPIAPAGAVKDYAIAFAVVLDKYRLEVGEATGRTETLSVTDGLSDDVKRELRTRLARSVRGESEPDGTPGDPERAGTAVDPAAAPGAATD